MTEDQLKHYQEILEKKGYTAYIESEKSLQVEFQIGDEIIGTICEFPAHFPYVFPMVRVREDGMLKCRGIPHVMSHEYLCLFNEADAKPNFLEPENLLLATVERAGKILTNGILGKNQDDFKEEIIDYWNNKSCNKIHLFADLPNRVTRFAAVLVQGIEEYYLAALSKADCEELYHKIVPGDDIGEIEYGLFLPLPESFLPQEVLTEKKMWATIDRMVSADMRRAIVTETERLKADRLHFFIVSVPDGNGNKLLLGWRGKGTGTLNGFRCGHASPFLYWRMQPETKSELIRAETTLCSQSRLHNRGGYGYEFRFPSAAVVGCGSVGSHLCTMLASMGTDRFLLFDYEILTVDNISRHTCGYSWIGARKALAMQMQLQRHNPNIHCDAFVGNAFDTVVAQAELICTYDILFIAVGDLPLEAYLLNLAKDACSWPPIAILWVEPRCYAAHMIYIQSIEDAFDSIIDAATMTYKKTVIHHAGSLIEHEPGCQSGYVPYSGVDVQQFLGRSLHELSRIRASHMQGNYHFIWIGELSEARRMKIPISPDFWDMEDYSFVVKRIG